MLICLSFQLVNCRALWIEGFEMKRKEKKGFEFLAILLAWIELIWRELKRKKYKHDTFGLAPSPFLSHPFSQYKGAVLMCFAFIIWVG